MMFDSFDPSGFKVTWLMRPLAILVGLGLSVSGIGHAAEGIDFDRQIRPILSDNCFSCHGPDAAQRQAELRLDQREAAVAHGAIKPDKLSESLVLERIRSTDPERMMPPPKSTKQLSSEQKQLLERWIAQGAAYTQHWSFVAPQRTPVPSGVGNPIDSFVQQTLQREGLTFAPAADPITLARRLSFDLVGLPPSAAQVQRLRDNPTQEGIAALVEELLASPHYGERMAIGWLDVVRFADTIGYHSDTPRNVFPYRDYVIASFNSNKPFDQFTIEQIAGDLLPDATQEQKIASCFNRLLLTTEEGGSQPKDYEARYLADRVRAIGTAWLGLTIGCAQCHDHKFDPITSHDFYAMGAFFADIDEAIIGKREEGMPSPSPAQAQQLQRLKVAASQLQAELDADHPQLADAQAVWEKEQLATSAAQQSWVTLKPTRASATHTKQLTIGADQTILAGGKRPDKDVYKIDFALDKDMTGVQTLRLEALPHPSLPAKGSGRAGNGNFVLTEVVVRVQSAGADAATEVKLAAARASLEQTQAAEKHPDKRWSADSVIDGDARGKEWGWAILPDVTKPQQLQVRLDTPLELKAGDQLQIEMRNNHGNQGHVLGHFRWSLSSHPQAFTAPMTTTDVAELIAIIQRPSGERTPEQVAKLRAAFHQATPALADLRQRLEQANKQLADFERSLPRCLVSKSLAKPRTVRILPRGNWLDESGPVVTPRLPVFLTSSQARVDRPLNRLDLANWLVSKDNPLTARVFVNRLWKQFFGTGLSKSLDDLGSQGEAPMHGGLLDHLAVEFIDSGWNVKQMVRTIVASRTYQQTSLASPELQQRDPENRLLARQSRYRLPAELVRDNALAIGGLLASDIGGPSIKPYQPDGYWENLNFPQRTYSADAAPLQHRRGLYVWWQRSFVHPSMLAFDAPTREECAADRPQSNIPQQALVMLNDPTYLEAASGFALAIAQYNDPTTFQRLARAFQYATSRSPNPKELELLTQLHATALQQYSQDKAAGEALIQAGRLQKAPTSPEEIAQLAAYIQVARAILNLHEVITRS